jgi:hypothetical protein
VLSVRHKIIGLGLLLAGAGTVFAQIANTNISVDDARSVVRLVLRHEGVAFPSTYCEIEHLDGLGKPFVPDYYSFGAHCDFPNTAARSTFGLFVVSPRTGDVVKFDLCEWYDFAELREMKQRITRRTHASDNQEQQYRVKTGRPTDAEPGISGSVVGAVPGGVPAGQTRGIDAIINSSPPQLPRIATPTRVRVSQGVMQAFLINKVSPSYPTEAKTEHIEGTVVESQFMCSLWSTDCFTSGRLPSLASWWA